PAVAGLGHGHLTTIDLSPGHFAAPVGVDHLPTSGVTLSASPLSASPQRRQPVGALQAWAASGARVLVGWTSRSSRSRLAPPGSALRQAVPPTPRHLSCAGAR